MKTSPPHSRHLGKAGFCLMFAWLFAAPVLAVDRIPGASRMAEPVTHVLFMGVELTAEKDRVFYPVVAVTGSSLVIEPGGKLVKLPLAQTANLRITESLKLAEVSVGLDQFKFERAYSADADPTTQLARTAAMAAGETAVVDLAQAAERRANMMVAGASAAVASGGNQEAQAAARRDLAQAQSSLAAAQANLNQALATPSSQIYDVGSQAARVLGEEMFDAIRVSFVLTAETDLAQPYYGIIARLRDPEGGPGQVRNWAYVHALGPLTAGESQRVTVYQSGFPPGYLLEGCEVHVYDGGQELATNLSRRRVPLTADEAREYRIIEYIGANKGRTLPASLASPALDAAARSSLTGTQLDTTCYVRVGKDGRVTAVFRDAAGKKPLADAALEAVLKTLRFNPALEAGKPVESITQLTLSQLSER